MTHDCRLGFPAALAHTEPDDVRVRRTPHPPTPTHTEIATTECGMPSDGLTPKRDRDFKTWAPSTSAAPVFKVGDRVRVRPGYISGDPYGPGTVVSIGAFVDVVHDYGPERPVKDKPAGWCEGNIEHIPL